MAFWLVAAAFWATMAATAPPTPLYVLYQRRLNFSGLACTAVFAAYAVVVLTAFWQVSDAIGRRRILLRCRVALPAGRAALIADMPCRPCASPRKQEG